MSRRDGVGRSQSEGHGFLKFGSETDLAEKLEEAAKAPKGRDGFGGGTDLDWDGVEDAIAFKIEGFRVA